jgi:hypothetical protein
MAAAIFKEDAGWAELENHEMSGERIRAVADYLLSSGKHRAPNPQLVGR